MIRTASSSPLHGAPLRQRRRIEDRASVVWRRILDDSVRHPVLVFKDQPNSDIFENITTKYSTDSLIVRNRDNIEAIRQGLEGAGWCKRVELHQRQFTFPDEYKGCRFISRSYGQDLTYLPSKILNTLYHETHACIDMVNSHYTILSQLFADLDIPAIKFYAANRDEIIRTFETLGLSGREVKTAFLSLIGSCPKMPTEFGLGTHQQEKIRMLSENTGVLEIVAELKMCYDKLQIDYPHYVTGMTEHAIREGKADHRGGVALSHLCFDVEDSMMRTAILTLQGNQLGTESQNIIWKFDGAVVPNAMVAEGDGALRKMQNAIADKYDLRVRFVFKPMTLDIFPECGVGHQPDQYQRFKKAFEKTYFKLVTPLCYARIVNGRVEQLKKEDWNLAHEERDADMVKQWVRDPEKLMYTNLGTYPPPLEVPHGAKNLWTGYEAEKVVEPMSQEELDRRWVPWEKHVSVTMGHDPVAIDWAHKLIAHIIQKPAVKTEKILFVRSIPGVGKDMFTQFLVDMLGSGVACKFDNFSQMMTQWTAVLLNKVLVVASETHFKEFEGSKRATLKAMATRKTFMYENKNEKPYMTNCFLNMILFTNEFGNMNMSKTDRRFVVAQSDSRFANKPEYHIPLAAYLEDKMNQVAVFRKYKQINLTGFNVHQQVLTAIHEEMANQVVGGQCLVPSFLRFDDNFTNWKAYATEARDPEYKMLGPDFLQVSSSALCAGLVTFHANLQWKGCDTASQAAQVLGRNMAEATAQANKYAPSNIQAIERVKRRIGGTPKWAYIFHIPTVERWVADLLSDNIPAEAEGPLPDAFARMTAAGSESSGMAPGFQP